MQNRCNTVCTKTALFLTGCILHQQAQAVEIARSLPFRALFQGGDVLGFEIEFHHLIERSRRFGMSKT